MLTIKDEAMNGNVIRSFTIRDLSEEVSVREIIKARIYQEVQDYNQASEEEGFEGLIKPGDVEAQLNPKKVKQKKEIDWEKQYEVACDAFENNGFFILIDDKQAESLEQRVVLHVDSEVSFIKLTTLVGG
ncbi:hypothetical protein Rhal01_01923 [Rubritalea halochordaticola]|uniref:Uncharacterized protein n=1 Tax=Rubritalea halochordaticola TaxID=714537 RepID=A0ABP9V1F6_9BACT